MVASFIQEPIYRYFDVENVLRPIVWSISVCLAMALSILFVQNRLLHKGFISLTQGKKLCRGSLVGGLTAGIIGHCCYHWFGATTQIQVIAWGILGGLVGYGMCFFIPNTGTKRMILGGFCGGVLGAIGFLQIRSLMPQNVDDSLGRFIGASILGLCLGMMISWIETISKKIWLTVIFDLRHTTQINLGSQVVTLGSGSEDTIFVAGIAPKSAQFQMVGNQVRYTNLAGTKMLQPGNRINVGNVELVICSKEVVFAPTSFYPMKMSRAKELQQTPQPIPSMVRSPAWSHSSDRTNAPPKRFQLPWRYILPLVGLIMLILFYRGYKYGRDAEHQALNDGFATLESDQRTLQTNYEQMNSERNELNAFRNELDYRKQQLDSDTSELENNKMKHKNLPALIQKQEQELSALTNKCTSLHSERLALESEIKQINEDKTAIANTKQKIANEWKSIEAARYKEETLKQIEEELPKKQELLKTVVTEIQKQRETLEPLQQKRQSLENEIKQNAADKEWIVKERQRLNSIAESHEKEWRLIKISENIKKELPNLQERQKKLLAEFEKRQTDLTNIERQLSIKERQLKDIERREKRCNEIEAEYQQWQRNVSERRSELAELKRQIANAENELERKQREIKRKSQGGILGN
ncbi:MAG: hypothetical protein LBT05_12020 [Planctomycetaceae bacterium]|nr:hypothetical protein [Planctomycetaceae bacterium]